MFCSIANKATIIVAAPDSVLLILSLKLENVLNCLSSLPTLFHNKCTKDLIYKVTLFNELCVFQDQISRRKIGAPRVQEIKHLSLQILLSPNFLNSYFSISDWHPSFSTLNVLFPSLFENVPIVFVI